MSAARARWREALRRAVLVALPLGLAACASTPEPDPRFAPAENLLEVVAVLRRHVPDDTYRFAPARDFSGRNVYRASLLRLENVERLHADALRAGHWDAVLAFGKARALERLRGYDLAAESYRVAGERDSTLRAEALRSAAVCDALYESTQLGYDPEFESYASSLPVGGVGDVVIAASEKRTALLDALEAEVGESHYRAVVREERERADRDRATHFVSSRRLSPEGNVRAVSELQRVLKRNRDSKNRNRHMLALADLYAELASEYVEDNPPESLLFDPATFQELVDSASRLYEAVANQDGTVEKLEASRRLEAFIAFTLRVDRDRFTP